VVNVTGVGTYADKNVTAAANKNYSLTSLAITGADAANYVLTNGVTSTAITTQSGSDSQITPRPLTVAFTGIDRVYDGGTVATVNTSLTVANGFVSGDDLSINRTAAYADKNVAYDGSNSVTSKAVSITSVSLSGTDAANYSVDATGSTTATVTPRVLNRLYDGGTVATVTTTDDRVSGDVFDINRTAGYANKNVGGAKVVSVSGVGLTNPFGVSSTDATNYIVDTTGSTTANITPRVLNVYYAGVDRVYDGGTVATVTTTDDRVSGDVFDINRTAGFADKHVSVNKAVSVSGVSITDPSGVSSIDAANYTVVATGSTTANITARPLTLTYSGVSKVYDGLLTASVTTDPTAATGYVLGDELSVNRTATFVDKNVGMVNINVTGVSLDGSDAANYQVVDANGAATSAGSTSANITPKLLSAALVGSIQKTYDGNTDATLNAGNYSLTGFVTVSGVAEGATVTKTAGTYNSRNVLEANSVSTTLAISDFTANSGTSLANYTLPTSATGAGSVGVLALSVSFEGVNRVYDGTIIATVTPTYTPLGSDAVDIVRLASFDNKNVDTNKTISVYSVSLSGADASNYSVSSTGTTSAHVTRQSSVTWVGGSSGEWFNPANWALTSNTAFTGVVPDKYNVSAVVVPQGTSISFDENTRSGLAEAGAVTVSHLTYQGTPSLSGLNLKAGELTVSTAGVVGALESTAGTTLNFGGTLSTDIATGVTKTVAGDLSGAGSFTKAGAGIGVGRRKCLHRCHDH
jgi:hypothetical protein